MMKVDVRASRATGVLPLLGALVLGGLLAPAASAQVKFNEIFTGADDHIEIVNMTEHSVHIGGWQILSFSAPEGQFPLPDPVFTFPDGTRIPDGLFDDNFMVVKEGQDDGRRADFFTGFNYLWTRTSSVELVLVDDEGIARDYVIRKFFNGDDAPHKPSTTTWTGRIDAAGQSIARQQPHDTNSARDWTVSDRDSTPGLNPGQYGEGNPHHRVMISEVSWGEPEAVEIVNTSFDLGDLRGWTVQWHDASGLHVSQPLTSFILRGERIVVTDAPLGSAPEPGVTHEVALPPLSTSTEAFAVALIDDNGVIIDEVRCRSVEGFLPPSLGGRFDGGAVTRGDLPGTGAAESIERIWSLDSDGTSDWTAGAVRSLGIENRSSGLGNEPSPFQEEIVLSEVSHLYVEIYNAGSFARSLENFFLTAKQPRRSPETYHPFTHHIVLEPGEYLVIGGIFPPSELPADVTYLVQRNFGFSSGPLELALYNDRGELLDLVRSTAIDSELGSNSSELPAAPFDFAGTVRRRSDAAAIARVAVDVDGDTAADWRAVTTRTMGSPNSGFIGDPGHADSLDVRVNSAGFRGLNAIINAGPERAGHVYGVLMSFGHAGGLGPVHGLAAGASILTGPPFIGQLDARGSAYIHLPAGSLPDRIQADMIWFVLEPGTLKLVARTLVLEYDT